MDFLRDGFKPENIFLKYSDFIPLNDFKIQNINSYFSDDNFKSESDLVEFNPILKMNNELFTFNNEIFNEINNQKDINGLKDLYDENMRDDKYLNDKKYFESVH